MKILSCYNVYYNINIQTKRLDKVCDYGYGYAIGRCATKTHKKTNWKKYLKKCEQNYFFFSFFNVTNKSRFYSLLHLQTKTTTSANYCCCFRLCRRRRRIVRRFCRWRFLYLVLLSQNSVEFFDFDLLSPHLSVTGLWIFSIKRNVRIFKQIHNKEMKNLQRSAILRSYA